MNIQDIISKSYQILETNELYDCRIDEILSKRNEDGTIGYQISAFDEKDGEAAYRVTINIPDLKECSELPSYDYNIDDYLLYDLENGFDIVYMSIDNHYGIWCSIDEWKDEIEHKDGLYQYLHYCMTHHISKETIGLRDHITMNVPDIMNLYKEKVDDYMIIDEICIGNQTVILGCCKEKAYPYATWLTTPARKDGYCFPKYYLNRESALSGLKSRSHRILDDCFCRKRLNEYSLKKDNQQER